MGAITRNQPSNKKTTIGLSSLLNYPKGVFFCMGNEFAERFSYYGMRAVLTLYLMNYHHLTESTTKLAFHSFVFIAYFTPLLGSILADVFFGRYKVILFVSLLYCLGHLVLTVGSFPIPGWTAFLAALDFIGLFTIAVATGGIKPCVSAFAADQFPPSMIDERKQFFSFFYMSINIGALLSIIVTPALRGHVSCFGQSTCFPLAFGVPALFMFIAFVVFICGVPFYKKDFQKDEVIWNSVKCVFYAISRKIHGSRAQSSTEHWLDCSVPLYGKELVGDVKRVVSILALFLPVIVFWGLSDQQGSTWVLQANRMNGRIGRLVILPDQIQLLNPLFIVLFIPIFEAFIYPMLASRGILTKSLDRMTVGGFLATASFLVAAVVQWQINKTMINLPLESSIRVTVINPNDRCKFRVGPEYFSGYLDTKDVSFDLLNSTDTNGSHLVCKASLHHAKSLIVENDSAVLSSPIPFTFVTSNNQGLVIAFAPDGTHKTLFYPLEKTADGNTAVYVLMSSFESYHANTSVNLSLIVRNDGKVWAERSMAQNVSQIDVNLQSSAFGSDLFDFALKTCHTGQLCDEINLATVRAETGAAVLLLSDGANNLTTYSFPLVLPNSVNIMWQFPQYFLITVGEILFSVSGLEFSYSQASPSMKSVLQAIYLLTIAFGNLLDMIISGSRMFTNAIVEFSVYALLMAIVMVIFMLLARKYKYAEDDDDHRS